MHKPMDALSAWTENDLIQMLSTEAPTQERIRFALCVFAAHAGFGIEVDRLKPAAYILMYGYILNFLQGQRPLSELPRDTQVNAFSVTLFKYLSRISLPEDFSPNQKASVHTFLRAMYEAIS